MMVRMAATIVPRRGLSENAAPLCWFKITQANNRHAAAGASQPSKFAACGRAAGRGKSRRLSRAEGRRGIQERNCVSN